MLKNPADYDASLEAFSRQIMALGDYPLYVYSLGISSRFSTPIKHIYCKNQCNFEVGLANHMILL